MLISQVRHTVLNYRMLSAGDLVLVSISGGADSVALFYVLQALTPEFGLKLHLAHLNHGFRKEAEGEAEFIRQLADREKVPYTIEKVDTPSYQRQRKVSPQVAARELRYRFLMGLRGRLGADKIAIGHTADDQAETVLQRLLRGTGPRGLSGIPPVRPPIIRPLLRSSRSDIESFLAERGLDFCQDGSNLVPHYQRNKIRLQLLPLLEQEYNPQVKLHLARLAELFRQEEATWDDYLAPIWSAMHRQPASHIIRLDLNLFRKVSMPVRRRIVRKALEQLLGDLTGISYRHILAILGLTEGEKGEKIVMLPGGLIVQRNYGVLELRRQLVWPFPAQYDYPVDVPGVTKIKPLQLTVETSILPGSGLETYPAGLAAALAWDQPLPHLRLRNRKPGDRFWPLGMEGRGKLKKFLVDKKVPRYLRQYLPLLVSGDEILWVAGLRPAEPYKISPHTKQILLVQVRLKGRLEELFCNEILPITIFQQ